MANTNSNRAVVPEAKDSLNRFKYEVASEVAAEEKLLEKAINHVYEAHPKWVKEKAAE